MTKSADIHQLYDDPSGRDRDAADVKPDPIAPEAPNWLSKRGRANWTFIGPELEKNALLTKRDREAFGFLCEEAAVAQEALLQMRTAGNAYGNLLEKDAAHAGRLRRHPAWIVYTQAKANFLASAKEFGLTPKSRIGLLLGGAGGVNPTSSGAEDDDDDELFG